MRTLYLYHDFTSPFCRLAVEAAAEVAERLGLELRAVPFELRPAPLPPRPPDDPDFRAEIDAARPLARELGVALERPAVVPRTGKAHEAVEHARLEGREVAFLRAVYRAYWREGADIGRVDVLAELAEPAGLDREELYIALGVDTHQAAVGDAQGRAEVAGIDGVPTFRMGERALVGMHPLDELLAWASAGP